MNTIKFCFLKYNKSGTYLLFPKIKIYLSSLWVHVNPNPGMNPSTSSKHKPVRESHSVGHGDWFRGRHMI